jgi:uncharacterized Zn-finger protein
MLSHIDPKYRSFAWRICYKLHNLKEEEEEEEEEEEKDEEDLVTEDSGNTSRAVNEICNEQSAPITTDNGTAVKDTISKPFQCNVCRKGFRRKSHLAEHALTHSDVKPFRCNICSKCFAKKSYLNKHLFSHSGVKPFQCNVCSKCFSIKSNVKDHMLTHSGV